MELSDHRRSAVRLAAGDTVGVGLGLFPIGMAFGLLVVQSGLEWWWAPVFSFLVYAGSMEFLLIGLVTATGSGGYRSGGSADGLDQQRLHGPADAAALVVEGGLGGADA